MSIHLRPIRAGEIAEICALHNRSEAHDGVPRVLEVEELAEELEELSLDDDTRLAELDGELAGYAYTYFLPAETGWVRCIVGHADSSVGRGWATATTRYQRPSGADSSW